MNDVFRKQKIRELNDKLRTTLQGGRVLVTQGIQSEGTIFQLLAMKRIAEFTDYNEANDPHGEHDLTVVEVQGSKVFAKIDYYDLDCQMHSPDEADEAVTCRVMTVMFGHEM